MIQVEFLYFTDCPGHEPAWLLLDEVLKAAGVQAHVERIEVADPSEVEVHRFLGSPSIRINGVDLEGTEAERAAGYGWRCRFYEEWEPGQTRAVPNRDLIRRRLENALAGPMH